MRFLVHALAIALAIVLVACSEAPDATVATAPAPGVVPDADRPDLAGDWVWEVDEAASTLAFSGTQNGEGFRGEFTDWEAAVRLNPDNLDDAEIDVRVALASARTGDRDRDEALPSRDWFDATRYPHARFRSAEITHEGRDDYRARGTLSIRGVSRPVVLPFTLDSDATQARARGALDLDRSDYGVGQGEFASDTWIAFPVRVEIDVVAERE